MKQNVKKLFFMIMCAFFSHLFSMGAPFIEKIKNWPNDQITRRLGEIEGISEQMNGVLPED